jgi:uncharacterized membrane protein YecN with MAPEG domain
MNRDLLLTISSLVSILLMTFHITDDIVRGLDAVGPQNLFGVLIFLVWLIGTLLLSGRLSGYIIMLLGGAFALLMPILHLSGTRIEEIVRSSGGFFFFWCVFVLGVIGAFSIVLSILQIRTLRSDRKHKTAAE